MQLCGNHADDWCSSTLGLTCGQAAPHNLFEKKSKLITIREPVSPRSHSNFLATVQVGGIMDRWEYVVAGAPLEEISIAEPLASTGELLFEHLRGPWAALPPSEALGFPL